MSKGLKPHHKRLLKEKKRCKFCLSTENLTYDHKMPLVRGGSNATGNIQVLCRACNGTKSALSNGDVWRLSRWFWKINNERAKQGKRPLGVSKKECDGLSA
jgi:5-methylcytosine-specific restriction endonuclease McrA